jgi:hypothetical protein
VAIATEFEEIDEANEQKGIAGAMEFLIAELRRQSRYHELYEALKMQARMRLGLPITPGPDPIAEEKQKPLEEALVEACREVGTLLMQAGQIRDGWVYLRPVGDREAAAKVLSELPVSHDNVDDLVAVLLSEGVNPNRGFDLALSFFGTCQSITLFDQEIVRHPKSVQQHAAAQLVKKVHEDLFASLVADIQRQVAVIPQSPTIASLIADRDWLFENNAYHIDTTHLAAVVRFAKVMDERTALEQALDLTSYGAKLGAQFHYSSEEPFSELYSDHACFFRTLLGENTEIGLAYFRAKAESIDVAEFGPAAIEVYVDLLARVGKSREALLAAVELFPAQTRSVGIAPTLLELARKGGDFGPMLEFCRSRGDLLGYAAALIEKSAEKSGKG